jgi:DNA-directed RNA polymerase subunit N (RpoN/RPB10)
MDTYKEYPIRCYTCNEQLACHAENYEQLLSTGVSIEDTLNMLSITNWCSRIAMQNPTIVAFNMENREVIEGFKSVENADVNNAQISSQFTPIFSSCLGEIAVQESIDITPRRELPEELLSMRPRTGFNSQIRSITKPTSSVPSLDTSLLAASVPVPATDEGIEVNVVDEDEFKIPTIVGIPTINYNDTLIKQVIDVGAGKKVEILNGRTYLAR